LCPWTGNIFRFIPFSISAHRTFVPYTVFEDFSINSPFSPPVIVYWPASETIILFSYFKKKKNFLWPEKNVNLS
jgi:hypothetical protein